MKERGLQVKHFYCYLEGVVNVRGNLKRLVFKDQVSWYFRILEEDICNACYSTYHVQHTNIHCNHICSIVTCNAIFIKTLFIEYRNESMKTRNIQYNNNMC